jgi:chaperonin GroES
MTDTTIQPLGNRILLDPVPEETVTESGLIIPSTAREKPLVATVVSVGSGKITTSGNREPPLVKEGDKVIYNRYGPTEMKIDGKDLLLCREDDIVALVEI